MHCWHLKAVMMHCTEMGIASTLLAHVLNLFRQCIMKRHMLVFASLVLQLVSQPNRIVLVSCLRTKEDRGVMLHGCCCLTGNSTPGWDADLDHTYMMDVIEEIGFDVSHRCYWDFGRWSDLCRVWRPAGDDLQFEQGVDFEVSYVNYWPTPLHLIHVARA